MTNKPRNENPIKVLRHDCTHNTTRTKFSTFTLKCSPGRSLYGLALVRDTPKFSPEAIYNAGFAHPEN